MAVTSCPEVAVHSRSRFLIMVSVNADAVGQTGSRRCTNSEWMTQRSTRMSVNAHHGWTGMNKKLVMAWKLTMKMPSHRA